MHLQEKPGLTLFEGAVIAVVVSGFATVITLGTIDVCVFAWMFLRWLTGSG